MRISLKTKTIQFSKHAPNFSSREWKQNETKVAEEYSRATKQAMGRPRQGRSRSSVLGFRFQPDPFV